MALLRIEDITEVRFFTDSVRIFEYTIHGMLYHRPYYGGNLIYWRTIGTPCANSMSLTMSCFVHQHLTIAAQ